MGEFRLTFGDVSKNQSISSEEMQVSLNRNRFTGKIQQSIFDLFDCKTEDGSQQGKNCMFSELEAAAGADGNVGNLSEEEALAFLKEHNIEDATAQDLFDFFNTVLEKPAEQKTEEEPSQKNPEQETSEQQTAPKKHNYYENTPIPAANNLNKNQQNEFYNQSIQDQINADLAEGNDKALLYSQNLVHEKRSNSYSLHEAQRLINPQGSTSLSVGASAQVGQEGMFNRVAAAGQVGIGENSRISGAVSYTKETGEESSSLLSAKVTEQTHFDFGGNIAVSGTFQNYQNDQYDMTREGMSVSGSVLIPEVEDTILHGGIVYVNGEVIHSTTTALADSNVQGSTTVGKGTLGASYTIGTEFLGERVSGIIGDLTLNTSVSAFAISDTDGVLFAGDIRDGRGIGKNFGYVPSGGWTYTTSPGLQNITLLNTKNVKVTGNVSYGNSNMFGLYRNIPMENYLSTGINTHVNPLKADFGTQYTLQQTQGCSPVHDVQTYYTQQMNIGDSTQGQITASAGYNSETGVYGEVGVSFNIGNRHKK